MVLMLRTGPQN